MAIRIQCGVSVQYEYNVAYRCVVDEMLLLLLGWVRMGLTATCVMSCVTSPLVMLQVIRNQMNRGFAFNILVSPLACVVPQHHNLAWVS